MATDASIILGIKQPQFTAPDPMEQATKSLTIQNLMRHGNAQDIEMRQAQETKAVLAANGNDFEKSISQLAQSGNLVGAQKLGEVWKQVQQAKFNKQFEGVDFSKMTADQADQLSAKALFGGHSGGVGFAQIGQKIRAQEEQRAGIKSMQSIPGVSPATPNDDEGNPMPATPAQPGVADFLKDSPHVGGAARALQQQIDAGGHGMTPQMIQSQLNHLAMYHNTQSETVARNTADRTLRTQIANLKVGQQDQIPLPAERTTAPTTTPSQFPRVDPATQTQRNGKQIQILQAERARLTDPREIQDIDREIAKLSGSPFKDSSTPVDNRSAIERAKGSPADVSSPEREKSIAFWADMLRKGGSLPPGLARNRDGAALVKDVMHRVAQGDTTPGQIMAGQAEFMGDKAGQRTLGNRTANIEMAVTEARNVIPLALSASDRVNRTEFPTLNSVLLAAEKGTGDTNVVQLGVATNSLINIYSRAISPTGVPTVHDKEHAREILANAYSKGQYRAAVDMMEQEMKAAQKSPGQVRSSMREQMTGGGPQRRTSDKSSPGIDALLEKYK